MKRALSALFAVLFALTAFGVSTVFGGFISAGAFYDYYIYTPIPGYSIYTDAELAMIQNRYFAPGVNETVEGVGAVVSWTRVGSNSYGSGELYGAYGRNLKKANHTDYSVNGDMPDATWAAKDTINGKTIMGDQTFRYQDGVVIWFGLNGEPFTGKVSLRLWQVPCKGPFFNGGLDTDDGDHTAEELLAYGNGFQYCSREITPDENGYAHFDFKTDFYQADWWSVDDEGIDRHGAIYEGGAPVYWPVPESKIAQVSAFSFGFSGTSLGDKISIGDIRMYRDSRVHLDELDELMAQFDDLNPEAYTEDSYAAATECYLVAYEIMSDPNVGDNYSQQEINAVAKRLKDALNALDPMFMRRSDSVSVNGFDVLTEDDLDAINEGGYSFDAAMINEDVIPDPIVNQSIEIIGQAFDGDPSYGWSQFATAVYNGDDEIEAVNNVFGAENLDESAGLRFWIKYSEDYIPAPTSMIIGVGNSSAGVYFECDPDDVQLPEEEGYVGVAWSSFYDIEGEEEIFDHINSLDYLAIRIEECAQKSYFVSDLHPFIWDINGASFVAMDQKIVAIQNYMDGLNKDDWTVRSWQRVLEALDSARALHDAYATTQQEVDKAIARIEDCVNLLTSRGESPTQDEIDALEAAYYNALTYWHGNYTGRSYADMKAVLDEVGRYINDEMNTVSCLAFTDRINTAVANLIPITQSGTIAPTQAFDANGNSVTVKLFSVEDFASGRDMSRANGHRVADVGYSYVKPANVSAVQLPANALLMTAEKDRTSKVTDQHGAMQFKLFDQFGNSLSPDVYTEDGTEIGSTIGDLTGSAGIRVWVGVNDSNLAQNAYFRFGVSNCTRGPLFEKHAVEIPFPASGSGWIYIPWESFDYYDDWTNGEDINLMAIRFWIVRVDGYVPKGLEVYTTCISAYTDPTPSTNAVPVVKNVTEGQQIDVDGGSFVPKWDNGAATLNGKRFIAGTPITKNDDYTLTVTNGDKQTSVSFTVTGGEAADTVPIVTGVEEGGVYEEPVTISWDVGEATLNSIPFEKGGVVSEPGNYVLEIVNGTKSAVVRFEIAGQEDEDPVISGVADGEEYEKAVSAAWTPETATATLNGEEYAAGTEISEPGEYTLVVTNGSKSVTVTFTIKDQTPPPPPVKKGDADGDGMITVADALAALRIAARLAESTPEMVQICDTDGDGSITVADALAILRVAAKLADESSLA